MSSVGIEVLARADFTPALLDELHALAVAMAAEDREHFAVHANTNDAVHLFRERESGELAGFQFWRSFEGPDPARRLVLGGKLRILPSYRRRGLHLVSALTFFEQVASAHPSVRLHRVSIASLFGFVSIAGALAEHRFVADDGTLPDADLWLCDVVAKEAARSGYRFDACSGLVDVQIRLTPTQLDSYPAEFYERPLARAYRARNPDFRDNGCYLAFTSEVSPENLSAMRAAIARRA